VHLKMINKYISNLIAIPSLFLFIRRCYQQQKQFMKETILLDLEHAKQHIDQDFTASDIKKITFYYGLTIPITGELLNVLKGVTITPSERKTLTYLGGLTGLFDDLFDEKETPQDHIKELLNNPSLEITRNVHERLVVQFYLKALEQEHSKRIMEYANLVYDAQILSKKQTNDKLSAEEILHITKQKGGISILLYRSALAGNMDDLEKKLVFTIGVLAQLENDIFDIYKDYQNRVYTLATASKSMVSLRAYYQSILDEIYSLIAQTDFPKRNKTKFSRLIATIATRGLVCLDQLIEIQEGETFEIATYSRSQLICDMGKLKKNIKWIAYYSRWNSDKKETASSST
jgi:uncharacterized protein YdcH (DUF465 family)